MKKLVLSFVVVCLAVLHTQAGVLIVYTQLNNGKCRVSVQYAPPGSSHYTVVRYTDYPGPCTQQYVPFASTIAVDPESDLGRAIRGIDPRADLNNVPVFNQLGLQKWLERPRPNHNEVDKW